MFLVVSVTIYHILKGCWALDLFCVQEVDHRELCSNERVPCLNSGYGCDQIMTRNKVRYRGDTFQNWRELSPFLGGSGFAQKGSLLLRFLLLSDTNFQFCL